MMDDHDNIHDKKEQEYIQLEKQLHCVQDQLNNHPFGVNHTHLEDHDASQPLTYLIELQKQEHERPNEPKTITNNLLLDQFCISLMKLLSKFTNKQFVFDKIIELITKSVSIGLIFSNKIPTQSTIMKRFYKNLCMETLLPQVFQIEAPSSRRTIQGVKYHMLDIFHSLFSDSDLM